MEQVQRREGWRCASMGSGAECVGSTGAPGTLKSSASSWDLYQVEACVLACLLSSLSF